MRRAMKRTGTRMTRMTRMILSLKKSRAVFVRKLLRLTGQLAERGSLTMQSDKTNGTLQQEFPKSSTAQNDSKKIDRHDVRLDMDLLLLFEGGGTTARCHRHHSILDILVPKNS